MAAQSVAADDDVESGSLRRLGSAVLQIGLVHDLRR
jgi:hypothetical protein